MKNIYSFDNYVDFMKWKIQLNSNERGYKTKLAMAAQCQPSFLSQVLGGAMHLTADHGIGLSESWGLTSIEKDYFITLIQFARAGTMALQDFYKKKLEEILTQKDKLSVRFDVNTFADDQMKTAIYYSNWINTAVHMLTGIKNYSAVDQIAHYFSIEIEQATKILNQLEKLEFVENKNGKWSCTKNSIHIAKSSYFFPIYHQQWRHQCIQSLEKDKNAMNYTGLYTLSKDDQIILKNRIIDFIEETRTVVKNSNEEKLMCFALDFFEVH